MTKTSEQAKNRDAKGRFRKGESGNPGGRPIAEFSFTELLRTRAAERPRLVDRLIDLCESEDENVALRALLGLANRLDGMPRQSVETEHKGTVNAVLKWADGDSA